MKGERYKMEWIPVYERLPNDGEQVLVCTTWEEMRVAYYDSDRGWCFPFGEYNMYIASADRFDSTWNIAAWCELPEPYRR